MSIEGFPLQAQQSVDPSAERAGGDAAYRSPLAAPPDLSAAPPARPSTIVPALPPAAALGSPPVSAQQLLSIQLDAHAQQRVELGLIWEHLTSGTWRVCEEFVTEARLYFVVTPDAPPRALPEVELLRRTLLGERQKWLALDIERSPSTVTTRLSASLVKMGLAPKPARVPLLLVAAAAAAAGKRTLPRARLTPWCGPDGDALIVSAARLDSHLRALVTPTEWVVARLLIDGLSYREIATSRSCSVRTVANQLASVFRKLRISGRGELLLRAVEGTPS